VGWLLRRSRSFHPEAGPDHRFVHIDDGGSARELTSEENDYLDTKFDGADGARPYIKSRYGERNGQGTFGGFLRRKHLPRRIPIAKS
jgi:hypothetical protein